MPNRSSSCDVAVIGAGVIGLAVGWRAAQRGLNVVVLERGAQPATETSSVAAGMIAPISEALATELPLMHLGLASARLYPEFVLGGMALPIATDEGSVVVPQGVGKVRNVGLDLRRWQSAARVRAQSLLSGLLPARSRLSSRPG